VGVRATLTPGRANAGFWAVAIAFTAGMAFSSSLTPLYPIYSERFGYSATITTVIFAAYPAGAILSFLLLAHVSDWVGRRRAVVPALLLEASSAVLFSLSAALPALIAARLLCGIAVAVLATTTTAWLVELDTVPDPAGEGRRSHIVATAANLGGVALGPLVVGAIATLVADPLVVPFVAFAVALPLVALAMTRVPETFSPPSPLPRYHAQRIVVPNRDRRRYFAAACGGMTALLTLSLFTALVPTFIAHERSHVTPFLTGAVASICCAAAAYGQIAAWRLSDRSLEAVGHVLVPAGVASVVGAAWASSLPLFLLAALVGGAGAGVVFRRMLSTVSALAPPEARAGAFAGMYLVVFFNGTLPIIALGAINQAAGPGPAATAFGAYTLAVFLWVTMTLRASAPAVVPDELAEAAGQG
jgi:MFS family permease